MGLFRPRGVAAAGERSASSSISLLARLLLVAACGWLCACAWMGLAVCE